MGHNRRNRGRHAGLPGWEAFDRSIDGQVSRLRKLVEPDPANPRYIQTVWGFGYVYVPDEPAPAHTDGDAAAAADASGTP